MLPAQVIDDENSVVRPQLQRRFIEFGGGLVGDFKHVGSQFAADDGGRTLAQSKPAVMTVTDYVNLAFGIDVDRLVNQGVEDLDDLVTDSDRMRHENQSREQSRQPLRYICLAGSGIAVKEYCTSRIDCGSKPVQQGLLEHNVVEATMHSIARHALLVNTLCADDVRIHFSGYGCGTDIPAAKHGVERCGAAAIGQPVAQAGLIGPGRTDLRQGFGSHELENLLEYGAGQANHCGEICQRHRALLEKMLGDQVTQHLSRQTRFFDRFRPGREAGRSQYSNLVYAGSGQTLFLVVH